MRQGRTIKRAFCRLLVVAVYVAFFTVQMTAYFSHSTGSVYRLNAGIFSAAEQHVKAVPDGFSKTGGADKKLSIRLNKKFQLQSALLYPVAAEKEPVPVYKKLFAPGYTQPFTNVYLLDHALRGPPFLG